MIGKDKKGKDKNMHFFHFSLLKRLFSICVAGTDYES